MRHFWITLLLITLTACSTPQPVPTTALLPTAALPAVQEALPSPTRIAATAINQEATSTPIPSPTPAAPPTGTATLSPSASPTPDHRVILENPSKFLLEVKDLPVQGTYFIPSSGARGTQRNATILSTWGQEGSTFLEITGRVDGWWVLLTRGSQGVRSPERVYNSITRFETVEGARRAVLEYNAAQTTWVEEGWMVVETPLEFGDSSVVLNRKQMQVNGKNIEWVRIEFAYHNFAVVVEARDWEGTVPLDFVEAAARKVLEKLEASTLQEPGSS